MNKVDKTRKILLLTSTEQTSNRLTKILGDDLEQPIIKQMQGLRIYNFKKVYKREKRQMMCTTICGPLKIPGFANNYNENNRRWDRYFKKYIEKRVSQENYSLSQYLIANIHNISVIIFCFHYCPLNEAICQQFVNFVDTLQNKQQNLKYLRMKYHDLNAKHIMENFNKLENFQINQIHYKIHNLKSEFNLRVSKAFTDWQTRFLQKYFRDLRQCKKIFFSPTLLPILKQIVTSYAKQLNFIQEPYYTLNFEQNTLDGPIKFKWKRKRLRDRYVMAILMEKCTIKEAENFLFKAKMTKQTTKDVILERPLPLNLPTLLIKATKYLKLSAKRVLTIAEHLYQEGYISYPRTRTNCFPKDFDFLNLIALQVSNPTYGLYANDLLQENSKIIPRNGTIVDHFLHPIYPTQDGSHLKKDNRLVFDFIAKYFLAACSNDALMSKTTITMMVKGKIQ
ncbi:DNA topoisomerase 3-alpha [Anaeramoeba flamelloides]|uniref:DNA topoisomerase n=1 Tax=Anaeramoeba flamelloides TaxID=1746091 RepID=A0ABQ8X882_9EUKA|nr:DNA topoisomerase 3-alpha [Anaeramoeba flamelloides]